MAKKSANSSSKEKPARVSHEERRERRRQIAEFVRKGSTVGEAALEFEVSVVTVRQSCEEHGVQLAK